MRVTATCVSLHPSRAAVLGRLFFGSSLLEELDDIAVTLFACNRHGRPAIHIPHIHVSALLEQDAHGGGLTFVCGNHQRRPTILMSGVNASPFSE